MKSTMWNDDKCTRKTKIKMIKKNTISVPECSPHFCTSELNNEEALDAHEMGDTIQNHCVLRKCQYCERQKQRNYSILKETKFIEWPWIGLHIRKIKIAVEDISDTTGEIWIRSTNMKMVLFQC